MPWAVAMISLRISALLGDIVRHRTAYGSGSTLPFAPSYSFEGEGQTTHVVIAPALVSQILARPADFAQADIRAAIIEIDKAGAFQHIPYFLEANPIQQNGSEHAQTRARFIAQFNLLSRQLDGEWRDASKAAFADLATGGFASPAAFARRSVDGFIDRVISACAENHQPGAFIAAGKPSSKSVFGFFHNRNRLAAEERSLEAVLAGMQLRQPDDGDTVLPVMLSFLVQGRDPLMGSMAALLNHLAAALPEARAAHLDTIDVRSVFAMASAVNYIGRIARAPAELEGLAISPDDHIVLILPPLAAPEPGARALDLSFGAGPHRCAGKAVAYQLLDIWLNDLKAAAPALDWAGFVPDQRRSGVFEDYGP
jgi:hypothetical protein